MKNAKVPVTIEIGKIETEIYGSWIYETLEETLANEVEKIIRESSFRQKIRSKIEAKVREVAENVDLEKLAMKTAKDRIRRAIKESL